MISVRERKKTSTKIKKKVVVGLSGGVDSAAAAGLLLDQGYDVYGLSLDMGYDTSSEDAEKVASYLGIPFEKTDMSNVFKSKVVDSFVQTYRNGETPNPCLICNPEVKWRGLIDYADKIGADLVATGHYADILFDNNGRYALKRKENNPKDQTYALYMLSQEQLKRTIMPLGAYTKDEIRLIAEKKGIPVAHNSDSMEICFIPNHDYASFIEEHTGTESLPGDFVDENGNVLGQHKGIIHYTVGQRKKLGIALGHPVYVTRINPLKNQVVLGNDDNTGSRYVYVKDIFFQYADPDNRNELYEGIGKIRYNHKGAFCRAEFVDEDLLRVEFEDYQRAVTPGQAFVLYKDGILMLGGTICGNIQR